MSILSTTICYPNPRQPNLGIFVQHRLAALHARMPLQVVAPVPAFPVLRPRRSFPSCPPTNQRAGGHDMQGPPVHRPTMWYVPGALKSLDARWFVRTLEGCMQSDADLARCRIIDAHFVWPEGVGAWRVAARCNRPFVCTLRGKLVSQSHHAGRRAMIAEMLRRADALIAVSQSLATLACDVAERDLPIAVIPNGVDAAIFRRTAPPAQMTGHDAQAREALGWSARRRYVVAVGHLQEIKGFHRLIATWPRVLEQCDDARLVLVGGPTGARAYERILSRLADEVNALRPGEPTVVFAGAQPADEIARMLNAADAFALASDSEGWCNAIAESLACGCPVVVTEVGGNRELVRSPVAGTLVPLDDAAALGDAIVDALSRTWDRAQIAEAGGRRSWQQVAAECVDVYEPLLR